MASNVCIKLNAARMLMQNKGLKQNGINGYANYKYFELADILPASNEICHQIGATIYCQFDKDMAHLFFVDNETGDKIEFTLPMSTANLKGCHEVQNLGAVQTYLKRYLYQNCYELSECDALDMTMNPGEKAKPEAKTEGKPVVADVMVTFKTKAEAELIVKKFEALAGEGHIKQESLANMQNAYSKLKSENDYRSFINNCNKNIQQAEKEKAQGFKDEEIPF